MPLFEHSSFEQINGLDLEEWLSIQERQTFSGLMKEQRQQNWLCGRYAAKQLVQRYLQAHSNKKIRLSEIEIHSGRHGEPLVMIGDRALREICVSISHDHRNGFAGLTQIREEGLIGVDVQKIRAVHKKLSARIFSESEFAGLRERFPQALDERVILCWSLKEAGYKCLRPLMKITKPQLRIRLDSDGKSAQIFVEAFNKKPLEANYGLIEESYYSCAIAAPALLAELAHD